MCGSNLPVGRDLGEPFLRERVRERAVHEADTVLELRLLVRGRELERTLEVVEHRHELAHQPLVGARGQLLLVARHPLAVVVELGLQPLERVEVLVALLLRGCELVDLLLDLLLLRAGAHSSTTSYSASSTTSSSDVDDVPFGCACSADACA